MKGKTAALAAYGVLLVCLAFALGYLFGIGKGETQVQITAAAEGQAQNQPPTKGDEESVSEARNEMPETETQYREPTAATPLDLNTAQQAELEMLPGIGPGLAERIITYRQANGPFITKEQVMDVEGIGEKRYKEMEHLITVGGTP